MDENYHRDLPGGFVRGAEQMGDSISFRCNHCGFQKDILLGVGYSFPSEYEEVVKDISEGCYGEEWRNLFLNTPLAAVNADLEAYFCPDCGNWQEEYNLSLYVPKQDAGQGTPGDYVCPWELPGKWKLLKVYIHKCPNCNKRMHRVRVDDSPICPDCGQRGMFESGAVLWD